MWMREHFRLIQKDEKAKRFRKNLKDPHNYNKCFASKHNGKIRAKEKNINFNSTQKTKKGNARLVNYLNI